MSNPSSAREEERCPMSCIIDTPPCSVIAAPPRPADTARTAIDLLLVLAIEPALRSELEDRGLMPEGRRRGCQLALNLTTATLDPRRNDCERVARAEVEVESWTAYALRECDRVLGQ